MADQNGGSLGLNDEAQTPPPGFNPLEADNTDLRRFGYPARPHRELHPRSYANWQRMMSRKARIVRTKGTWARKELPTPTIADRQPIQSHVFIPPSDGAGAVVAPGGDLPLTSVQAQFTIPNVMPPASAWNAESQTYNEGNWGAYINIGLQKAYPGTLPRNSSPRLSFGVAFIVSVSQSGELSRNYSLASSVPGPTNNSDGTLNFNDDLAMSAGDTVFISLSLFTGKWAVADMTNSTANTATSLVLDTWEGASSGDIFAPNLGQVLVGDLNFGSVASFPSIGSVIFSNCSIDTTMDIDGVLSGAEYGFSQGITQYHDLQPDGLPTWATAVPVSDTVLQVLDNIS
jgi:Peptidase A4 family